MRGKDEKRHLDCESGVVKYGRVGGVLNSTNLEVRIEKARKRTRGIWGERNTDCVYLRDIMLENRHAKGFAEGSYLP